MRWRRMDGENGKTAQISSGRAKKTGKSKIGKINENKKTDKMFFVESIKSEMEDRGTPTNRLKKI